MALPEHKGISPQLTTFVGREVELAEIAHLLADPACRLLTLLGQGGMGKTRLAWEVTAVAADEFNHGLRSSLCKQCLPPIFLFRPLLMGWGCILLASHWRNCAIICKTKSCCWCWIILNICWQGQIC